MRIAITGASGNIGSAVLRRLGADGEHQIVGLARRVPASGPDGTEVDWVSADLTKDESVGTLERAFDGADAVVHLAWGFQPSHDLAYLEELGVGATGRVLQAVAWICFVAVVMTLFVRQIRRTNAPTPTAVAA